MERWLREREGDLLAHIEDEYRSRTGAFEMEIIGTRDYIFVLRDEQGNTSDVFQQGDGKFKCLRCNRYRCEHVKFVQASGQVPPRPSQEELSKNAPDILTY